MHESKSNPSLTFPTTLYALGLLAAMLPAQQGDTRQQAKGTAPAAQPKTGGQSHFLTLEEMLGSEVELRAAASERREAQAEGEKADRPEADVEDLLLYEKDGTIRWLAIDVGGFLGIGDKTVAVPISAVDCRPKDAHRATVTIQATENQLADMPAFDLQKAQETGLAEALRVVEASWTAIGFPPRQDTAKTNEDAEKGDGDGDAKAATGGSNEGGVVIATSSLTAMPVELLCASKIGDWKVRAKDGAYGAVVQSLVKLDQHPRVAYLIVNADESDHEILVPFAAVQPTRREEGWAWMLSKTNAELKEAVRYEKPATGLLDEATCRRAHAFFGVDDENSG